MKKITRREFIRNLITFGGTIYGLSSFDFLSFGKTISVPDLVVIQGKNVAKMLDVGLSALGGINKFVKKGDVVVIKPNMSFSATPEEAANTNPEVVGNLVRMCFSAKAKRVIVLDHTIRSYLSVLNKSGIKEEVDKYKGEIITPIFKYDYQNIPIPKGKSLKKTDIAKQILEANVLINVPICKVHTLTKVTLGMKNLMGIVWDRGEFHRKDIHQCIADLCTNVRQNLIILDAIRILKTNGPGGPGEVERLNKIILGCDPVAVDSYGAGLLGFKGTDIPHIKYAHRFGLGKIDIKKIKIKEITT